jgi:hypothetical protein
VITSFALACGNLISAFWANTLVLATIKPSDNNVVFIICEVTIIFKQYKKHPLQPLKILGFF